MSVATQWQTRITGTGEADPAQLAANPRNYRRHPEAQRQALGEILDGVGWVAQVVVNKQTGRLVDGHLRVEMAVERGEPLIPVTYVDLSEDEERVVLAALDPIAAMAEVDAPALAALVDSLNIDGALGELIGSLLPPDDADDGSGVAGDLLAALSVSLSDPRHQARSGETWRVGERSYLVVASVYDGWPVYGPLLTGERVLVPYPTPIVPLTERARDAQLVMVQPDEWLAGHLLDKYAEVYGDEAVACL